MDPEDAAIGAINALVDAALESAEAALLNLDTDADAVQCGGRFAVRPPKRQLALERSIYDPVRPVTFTEGSSSGSCTSIPTPLHSSTPRKSPASRSRTPSSTPSQTGSAVDVFRFPLRGEDARLNARDGDGTSVDTEEVKRLRNYYNRLKTAKQCGKCCKNLLPQIQPQQAPSYSTPSTSTTSVQSPIDSFTIVTESPPVSSSVSSVTGSTFSVTPTVTPPSAPTEYTTSRLTSSVVTKPSQTAPTCRSSGVLSSDASGLSVDFTTVVKDPKSGQTHPLHFVAKCPQGQPARVFINGKAFGPCSD
uniref:VWFD domain-containing protein n=1 Tax=Panagrellus redivivus TaxID=6233 RepID=A0A7E5A0W0_PANRE